jgi:hypothetical protein
MNHVLLLDLEETIVQPITNDYYELLVDNINKIKKFHISSVYPKDFVFSSFELITLSWALWDQKDVDRFNLNRERLETSLELKFSSILTIQNYIELLLNRAKIHIFDNLDFFDYYGKEKLIFELCLNGWKPNSCVYLIDDSVESCSFEIPKYRTKCDIININDLNK